MIAEPVAGPAATPADGGGVGGAAVCEDGPVMAVRPLLEPRQATRYRHAFLVGVGLAGAIAGIIVLSSQEVADFLREGPVRVTGMRDDTLRIVLGLGVLVSTAFAVVAIWPRARILDIGAGLLALGLGLFLVHALLMPAALLFGLAVLADVAGRVPRERLQELGPRRYPIPWAAGGAGAVAGLVGLVWLSVWLIQPLFDEGETLNEMLTFNVEGLEQPVLPSSTVAAAAAGAGSAPATDEPATDEAATNEAATDEAGTEEAGTEEAATEEAGTEEAATEEAATEEAGTEEAAAGDTAEPAAQGMLISRGELMGADAFHTGSGDVLLVVGPAGEVILRFQDYAVRNGPDLHVYLTPDPGGDVHAEGAVDLGAVKATNGFVNYDVPAGVDPSSFRVAVIYCVPFGVIFATASLSDA